MARIGGQHPDSYGASHSVYVTNVSETTPVDSGYPLVWDNTAGHSAALPVDGDPVELIAKHRETETTRPVGVWITGQSDNRINVLTYSGTAPAIGSAVVADGNGGVRAADTAGGETGIGRVLYVDTANNEIDLLV